MDHVVEYGYFTAGYYEFENIFIDQYEMAAFFDGAGMNVLIDIKSNLLKFETNEDKTLFVLWTQSKK